MPTTYAHYRFGRSVYKQLPKHIQTIIRSHGGLYNIGLHGPDLLFYYRVFQKNHVNQTGFAMHAQPGKEFFQQAALIVRRPGKKSVSFIDSSRYAYLFGFLCHFALDSNCHPYVEQMVRKTGISHSEIEAELDRELMIRDGLNPMTCRPTSHLKARIFYGGIISGFFPGITPHQIAAAIRYMKICCNLLAPSGQKLHFIIWYLMKVGHLPAAVQDMVIRKQPNPACAPITRELERRYRKAVIDAAELIINFMEHTQQGTALDSRLDHTFGEE